MTRWAAQAEDRQRSDDDFRPGPRRGWALIDYSGATGATGYWYAFGLGPNDALAQMNGAGTTRATYVPDIQGSIVASLDALLRAC